MALAGDECLEIERGRRTARLTLDQRRSQSGEPRFLFLQQAKSGPYDVARRSVATMRDLGFHETGEVLAEAECTSSCSSPEP